MIFCLVWHFSSKTNHFRLTIALIALWRVPIALWLSPNSYNVFKKSSTWLTIGWWGLSCCLLQKSSHCCRTGVLYADCVLTLHDALMIWATSGDSPAVGRCQTNLLLLDWADPRLGVDSLFLVVGAGVGVLVSTAMLSLVSPLHRLWEPRLCLPARNYHQGCRPILCKFGQHSSNYTKLNGGKIVHALQGLTNTGKRHLHDMHLGQVCIWCILQTFGIQSTSKQFYFCFPKLIKKGLGNPLI